MLTAPWLSLTGMPPALYTLAKLVLNCDDLVAKGSEHLTLFSLDDGSSFQVLPRDGGFAAAAAPDATRPALPTARPVAGLAAHPDPTAGRDASARVAPPGLVDGAAAARAPGGGSPRRTAAGTVRGDSLLCMGMFMLKQTRFDP